MSDKAKIIAAMNEVRGSYGAGKARDVLEAVADMIVARGLGLGDRLPPEVELARELGVARSTVREALKAWQGMGIVTRNKGAGTVLRAPISAQTLRFPMAIALEAQSLERMLEVRRPLEVEAARLAAERADARQRHEVMTLMYALMDSMEGGEDWRPQDHAFHAAVHEATGNPLYKQLIDQLLNAFHAVYEAPFGEPQLGTDSIPLHRPLAQAIHDGDGDEAARIMHEIIDLVASAVRAKIPDQGQFNE